MTGSEVIGGRWNIFLGNNAGLNSLSPVRNIFIGYDAGRSNVSGQYNLYVGDHAGSFGTGTFNTVIGGLAFSTNDFGNSNVALGYVAGSKMVSSNNVVIGAGAGYANSGIIGGNVFIGYYAGEELSTQDNRLAISSNRSGAPLIYGEFDNKRVAINSINSNGYTFWVNGTAGGVGSWNETSDMRLKTNILSIGSALDKVLQLKGVRFNWIDQMTYDNKTHIGFIAQDVEKVIPEVVNKTNDQYSMQYAPITALLVEGMKEQQNQIESLKSEIEELKKLCSKLAEQISKNEP